MIHVDPRFTRTSAVADLHVPIRAGTRHRVPRRDRQLHPRERALVPRVRAALHERGRRSSAEEFADTEDLDGLFSGWDPEAGTYDVELAVRGRWAAAAGGRARDRRAGARRARRPAGDGRAAGRDPTLQHPRCVFQILKRHFSRYTPEMVEQTSAACRGTTFLEVAEALCANSGPRAHVRVLLRGRLDAAHGRRAVHPHGGDHAAAARQHRPAGRRHPGAARPRVDPGLDRHPDALQHPARLPADAARRQRTRTSRTYVEAQHARRPATGATPDAYIVSLLKAWWGDAATAENDFCFDYLPRITGDHSTYPTILAMLDGQGEGLLRARREPGGRLGATRSLHRLAMAKLDWLVVRDFQEIETRVVLVRRARDRDRRAATEDIATEVFFLPAAAHTEKDGSFTNTQRLLQWHHKAVEPPGDCRSELWFMYHLGRAHPREARRRRPSRATGPLLDLTWDYPTAGRDRRARAPTRCCARSTAGTPTAQPLSGYTELKADGSTTCGCWIYCGCYAGRRQPDGAPQAGRRADLGGARVGLGLAAEPAHPLQPRLRRPGGQAVVGAQALRVVGRGARTRGPATTCPTSRPTGARTTSRPRAPTAEDALRGDEPFIMQADGRGWLFAPSGLVDGPLPDALRAARVAVRATRSTGSRRIPPRERYQRRENPYHPTGGEPGARCSPTW